MYAAYARGMRGTLLSSAWQPSANFEHSMTATTKSLPASAPNGCAGYNIPNTLPVSRESGVASTTRYWDCSGGACGCMWKKKCNGSSEALVCNWEAFGELGKASSGTYVDADGVTHSLVGLPLGTAAGSAFLMNTPGGGGGWMAEGCGDCYVLESTGSGPANNSNNTINAAGKGSKMIVQLTNFCPAVGQNMYWCSTADSSQCTPHFDIAVPGGGQGASASCEEMYPGHSSGFNGGKSSACPLLPPELRESCVDFFDMNWDNVNVKYTKLDACPRQYTENTVCSGSSWGSSPAACFKPGAPQTPATYSGTTSCPSDNCVQWSATNCTAMNAAAGACPTELQNNGTQCQMPGTSSMCDGNAFVGVVPKVCKGIKPAPKPGPGPSPSGCTGSNCPCTGKASVKPYAIPTTPVTDLWTTPASKCTITKPTCPADTCFTWDNMTPACHMLTQAEGSLFCAPGPGNNALPTTGTALCMTSTGSRTYVCKDNKLALSSHSSCAVPCYFWNNEQDGHYCSQNTDYSCAGTVPNQTGGAHDFITCGSKPNMCVSDGHGGFYFSGSSYPIPSSSACAFGCYYWDNEGPSHYCSQSNNTGCSGTTSNSNGSGFVSCGNANGLCKDGYYTGAPIPPSGTCAFGCYYWDNEGPSHYCSQSGNMSCSGTSPNANGGGFVSCGSADGLCKDGYYTGAPVPPPSSTTAAGAHVRSDKHACMVNSSVGPDSCGPCPWDANYGPPACVVDTTTSNKPINRCCGVTFTNNSELNPASPFYNKPDTEIGQIEPQYCGNGKYKSWLPNTDWIPNGTSTHYGNTTGGACGFSLANYCGSFKYSAPPFDDKISSDLCQGVPDDLKKFPAGRYAAPTGAYYSQEHGYLSCGECIEIQAVNCEGVPVPNRSVTVQISDSCPCGPNPKWCCGPYSVRPNFDAASSGTIHLDLSNPAFSALNSSGDASTSIPYGVVATQYRRVSCSPQGNMYAVITVGHVPDSCASKYAGCESTSNISFQIANVAGAGSLWSVEIRGATSTSADARTPWSPMIRNADFSSHRPQEQYGVWTGAQNVTYYFPLQFRITDSLCNAVITPEFSAADFTCAGYTSSKIPNPVTSSTVACFQNLGVQMPASLQRASMPTSCDSSSTACYATQTCLQEQQCIISGMGRYDCSTSDNIHKSSVYAMRVPDARSTF